jgi:hypothetical protein
MDASVAVCAGMRAITHFVSLEPRADPRAEAEAIASANTIPLVFIPDDEVSKGMNVGEWDVVNQSAGGLKVRRTEATTQAITVGEAIGIKFLGQGRWTIGVVRWLTVLDEGGMEFGIQFLAPEARCIAIQQTVGATGQTRAGLLLSEEDGFESADSILAAPATYSDLREFEIEDAGVVSRVRATSLIEKTGRFELFHTAPS